VRFDQARGRQVTNEHDPLAGLSRRELRELRARLDQAENAAIAAEAAAPGDGDDIAPIEPGAPVAPAPAPAQEEAPVTRPANSWDVPTEPVTIQHTGSADPDATVAMPTIPDPDATALMPIATSDNTRTEAVPFVDQPVAPALFAPATPAADPAAGGFGAGDGSTPVPEGDDMADKPRKPHRARNITLIVLLVL